VTIKDGEDKEVPTRALLLLLTFKGDNFEETFETSDNDDAIVAIISNETRRVAASCLLQLV